MSTSQLTFVVDVRSEGVGELLIPAGALDAKEMAGLEMLVQVGINTVKRDIGELATRQTAVAVNSLPF